MPAVQLIGRVGVKVLPDTDDFRRDAKRKLDAIEKSLEISLPTVIDLTGARRTMLEGIRKINAENRAMDSRKIRLYTTVSTDGFDETITRALRQFDGKLKSRKLKINADLVASVVDLELSQESKQQVAKELRDFQRDHSPIKINVSLNFVNGSLALSRARLDFLARPRTVQLFPVVNSLAASKAATALAALSGARAVGTILDDIGTALGKLDKNLPLIGSLALAIAGLGGYALTAASNLFALSSSLAQIGPAALVLPGIFGGLAIGVIASAVALKDFNKYVPEFAIGLGKAAKAGQAWKMLQDQMSDNFWAKAAEPFKLLINTLFPQFFAGMTQISTSLGGFFGAFATALTGVFNGALANMFKDLSDSITIATTGTSALANIIKILGETGAGYLPRLAQWFVDLSTQFSNFLTSASSDGRLQGWIDNAIFQLTELGRVLGGIGGIFADIVRAAEQAGGSTLTMMADTLERVNNVTSSAGFQSGLVGTLNAAHQAMSLIAERSGPQVETFFATLTSTLQTILPIAGAAIGTLLGAVAGALSQPAFTNGLIDFFTGLQAGIEGLAPAFGPVAQVLGSLGTILGAFAAQLGPLLASVFQALAPMLLAILPALQPIITVLTGALTQAVTGLAPVFATLGTAIAGLLSGGLLPALTSIVSALVPIIVQLALQLAAVLVPAFNALGPILVIVGQAVATVLTALGPLLTVIIQLAVAILGPVLTVLGQLIADYMPKLAEVIVFVINALVPLIAGIASFASMLMVVVAPVLQWIGGFLLDTIITAFRGVGEVVNGLVGIFQGAFDIIAGLFTGDWARVWNGAKELVIGVWNLIKGAWDLFWSVGILKVAKVGLQLIKDGFALGWNAIRAAAIAIWDALKVRWSTFLNELRAAPGAALTAIRNLFSGAWSDIKLGAQLAWGFIKGAFINGVSAAVAAVRGLPSAASAAMGNVGSTLLNAGRRLIQGFIDGIKGMFSGVQSTLGNLTSKLTSWKGPESLDKVLLTPAGQLVIEGFLNGLESRYDVVRKSLQGFTKEIGNTEVDSPTIGAFQWSPAASQALRGASLEASSGASRTFNYYAAPGSSLSSEEELFLATERSRMVGW
jgi:phage-related protein